jgi:redox-sensitive bicupin YhaK (pirin superfamily)
VHVARGEIAVNGTKLGTGDGAKISGESALVFDQAQDAEFLLFDMG